MTVLITGATSGLGRQLATELAEAGHTVLVHGRDPERTMELAARLPGTRPYVADLSDLRQVHKLITQVSGDFPQLDWLVNNASIGYGSPDTRYIRELSVDKIELRFAVNYLAPYLLGRLLAPRVRDRIVNIGSAGQESLDLADLQSERDYDGLVAYRRAKLALTMATFDLAADYESLAVNVVHPGGPLATVEDRAAVTLEVITGYDGLSGTYFNGDLPAKAHPDAYDPQLRARLRDATEELLCDR
ncbi:SDR family NAD(P)-dependent oxidoreductase [Pseudonocardiaceae bacterium YIM PH 21723]|nr:SDR family NAD(P)-dependent oxidoreductase [Pseudonocardiaceae bacterium YIM PH 21723]